jgi:phenylalanyl-tRNA synthetase alpha chain
MLDRIEELKTGALRELEAIKDDKELEVWRVKYLGRKSDLTGILRGLAQLPIEERRNVGAKAGELKNILESTFEQKKQALTVVQTEMASRVTGAFDITLPGRKPPVGRLHPITQTIKEISDIFMAMGFEVREGPEVELDYYNFEALNIPAEHPSRDNMSTFWVDSLDARGQQSMLLHTHTTSVTARTLEGMKPPIRVIEPGRIYRYEAIDATHGWMFHQIDGIAVDKHITLGDLKGTLYEFARRYFGNDRKVRFRCDFFPFVEPGVEMAIDCAICHGSGCRLCGGSGWIEILGAGMTHPMVLKRGGIDPDMYSSFAFGIGIDRLPMLRYGIDDIRLFYGSDLRFLRQF